jgi:thioesterase domain-containing protein
MPLPNDVARRFIEEKIPFVSRAGLAVEAIEPGYVRLRMPLDGNQNHIGSMYAGALFTLAEIPGGALFLTSFDVGRFYPVIKDMQLRFLRPAVGDIRVEARLRAEEIERLQSEATLKGKAEYELHLQLVDANDQVVAESHGRYQLRAH